ncbi:conjugal transfer protein TraK [Tunicatimonas pelagia]|uniref:conjugal transfer protein TraK n=1 Tax=Tunicatimonas pelagia TaxID=931531 RepID=UPI00266670D5|nr:conjugal transfer protein TraK [Tunicatimonas pelagia]WKN44922.1 conjugal transfer protein TraK [Tunicatimonas pelagia]
MSKVRDFNKTFKTMRLLAVICLLGFMAATVAFAFLYQRVQEYYQHRTYVITSWGTFPASYYDGRKVSRIEVQNHIETFVKNMFAHSAETYYEHINFALNLIDEESGKRIYHDFEEGDVHKNYVRYGSHTEIKLDSVVIDMRQLPIAAKFYALQEVHIGENVRTLPIAASFQVLQDYRHDKNPYGLLLTNFDFIAYPRKSEEP